MDTTEMTDEERAAEEARGKQIEQAMIADGINPEEGTAVDYFAFNEVRRVMLPDGVQWVEHKLLNEGDRRKYLNAVNKDVRMNRATQDVILKMAPGEERKELLKSAICGWYLVRNGDPLAFGTRAVEDFLTLAPPKVIDLIEADVRKANAWLVADMTAEDLRKQITELEELLKQKEEEEEGKAGS